MHGSLLPAWRGAAPVQYALWHGAARTGATLTVVDPRRFDGGRVLATHAVDVGPHERLEGLLRRLAVAGAGMVVEALPRLESALNAAQPQDDTAYARHTHCHILPRTVTHCNTLSHTHARAVVTACALRCYLRRDVVLSEGSLVIVCRLLIVCVCMCVTIC